MPTLETPPNPAPPSEPPPQPTRLRTRRFGELEEHELLHLLDALDDERSRSRFRESIYASLLIYIALAWFVIYGPRVLFHTPSIAVIPQQEQPKHELTYLETPPNLSKLLPKPTKIISEHTNVAQTAHPAPNPKTLAELEAMRRAGERAPTPSPQPRPLPPAPQPQPSAPQPQPQPRPQPRPLPSAPQPSNIPDAPRPTIQPNQPSPSAFSPEAANRAAHNAFSHSTGGGGGEEGAGIPVGHAGANTGYEILSDTRGVDFANYIRRLLIIIRANWIPLIPEEVQPPISKEGSTLIRFTINKDGTLAAPHLDDSTHDRAIDEAAWGAITSNPSYPPLPAEFTGPSLTLRIQFVIFQRHRNTQ